MQQRSPDPSAATLPAPGAACRLPDLADRIPARVVRVEASPGSDRARQLADIGFVPGEPVMLMARGWPGGDPLVVRIGASTFALRRAEAECIEVAR